MVVRILVLIVCAVVSTLAGRASAQTPIIMKMGTATVGDTQTEWMSRFKAAVERDSKGRIAVQIYPGSQLGTIPREIEDTQFGSIQGWVGPPEFLVGVDRRFGVLSAPGVFTSWEQATKTVLDERFRTMFLDMASAKGLKGIGLWLAGDNDLFLRKPVRSISEAKGLKIRILAGPLQEATMRVLGATGVAMPLDQVAPALQQGAIDGIITNLSTAAPLKYYASAPYATRLGQPYIFSVCMISRQWFDRLPADLQKIIVDDGLRIARDFLPFSEAFYKKERQAWIAGGGRIIDLPPEQQKELMSRFVTIGPTVLKDDPGALTVYKELIAARDRVK